MNRTMRSHEITPIRCEVECVLKSDAIIGEGPHWSVRDQRLYWADIAGQKVHVFNPADGKNTTFPLPDIVTSISTRTTPGSLLLTLRRSIATFDLSTARLEVLAEVEADNPKNRFNDGKCDRQGRLWAGTMGDVDWDQPVGSLYRFEKGKGPTRTEEGICCSNGLGWSPDSKTMYFCESFRYRIHAYDFDAATGSIANRRTFATIDADPAFFDGLTVDAEGFVWSAQPMFGRLVRYDPKGKIERILELPVSRGTSCMFGGPDLDTLYVTTMRATLTDEQLAQEPLAGSLLALKPGVRGLAEVPFAG
jgi:sugar lactone lactonase YvrE